MSTRTISLVIPEPREPEDCGYAKEDVGYVQVQALTHIQKRGLTRLYGALDAVGVRLENGRRVVSRADAIRWLLEQIPKQ